MKNQIEKLNAIIDASKKLTSILDINELLQVILEVAVKEIGADRGTVFLKRENREEIYSRVLKGGQVEEISLKYGDGIAGIVAQTTQVILIDDAYSDPRFNRETDLKSGYRTSSVLCLPITKGTKTLGVIQLLNSLKGTFDEDDSHYLSALAAHIAIAIENAISLKKEVEQERTRKELELATQIQDTLLPASNPNFKNLSLAKTYRPCHSVGGDLFDFFELDNGHICVIVADVAGKGIPAAMITSALSAFWKALREYTFDLREFCFHLNNLLLDSIPLTAFATMIFLEIDVENKTLSYCNCGHNPGLLASGDSCIELGNTGVMLGMFKDYPFRINTVDLKRGDRILIYTDGLSEASYIDKEERHEFGLNRISRIVQEQHSPAAMLNALDSAVDAFTGGQDLDDDLTAIALMLT